MHIFIDESGNFIIPKEKSSKISSVTSLIVPDKHLDEVMHSFKCLKISWKCDGEIKGSRLTEKQISDTIALLRSYDVLVEISWLNVGHHSTKGVDEYKQSQADKLLENVTEKHQERLVKQLQDYRQRMLDLPNQLFIQAMLSIQHIKEVVNKSTWYYCQRIPEELGNFVWLVDAKNSSIEKTPFEELWSTLILPFLDANFSFLALEGGDYSYFDKNYSMSVENISEWRRDRMSKKTTEVIDAKKILSEQFYFQDSKSHLGLQLVDIVSSAFSRAMNGTLKRKGWRHLGMLMVQAPNPILFVQDADEKLDKNFPINERHILVWQKIRSDLKPILIN